MPQLNLATNLYKKTKTPFAIRHSTLYLFFPLLLFLFLGRAGAEGEANGMIFGARGETMKKKKKRNDEMIKTKQHLI